MRTAAFVMKIVKNVQIVACEHVRELPNLLLPDFERTELFKKCHERTDFKARTEVHTALPKVTWDPRQGPVTSLKNGTIYLGITQPYL